MAGQDSKLAGVISVLNDALQVALLLVERDRAIQHVGADAAQIRDAVFRAATAAHDLWLMTQTEEGRYSLVSATARDADRPLCAEDSGCQHGRHSATTAHGRTNGHCEAQKPKP